MVSSFNNEKTFTTIRGGSQRFPFKVFQYNSHGLEAHNYNEKIKATAH